MKRREPAAGSGSLPASSDYAPPGKEEMSCAAGGFLREAAIVAAVLIVICACIVMAGTSPPDPVAGVTVSAGQPDAGTIIVTCEGGPKAGSLREIRATVITPDGEVREQAAGSASGTAPPETGTQLILYGPFAGIDRVIVAGTFDNDEMFILLDTRL